jgi:acyl-CoA synthetase (AMP-forming)/AMP-acid ligase II
MFGAVSTMLTYMRDAQEEVGADLSSLETLGYGGSPFAPTTLTRTMEVFDCDMLQFYGQTETSILITCLGPEEHREALAAGSLGHRLRSAGRVVPMIEMRVVDESGTDCERDGQTVGEVAARGPSVMSGYWNDPERTAETIKDGWLHTGDMATWDADGYVYIVDRRKDMIISGGENIYPQAVEDVIHEHPAVENVAVIGVGDPVWGEVVKAVIVTRGDAAVTVEEIQSLCARRLARYMQPRLVEFVDDLPKSPTGRILRREVRELHSGLPEGAGRRRLGEV